MVLSRQTDRGFVTAVPLLAMASSSRSACSQQEAVRLHCWHVYPGCRGLPLVGQNKDVPLRQWRIHLHRLRLTKQ